MSAQPWQMYVGTYTNYGNPGNGRAEGLYLYYVDPVSGDLTLQQTVNDVANPSFQTLHPNGNFLYSVNEGLMTEGQPGGGVSAFSRDPQTGKLTFLNRQQSHGTSPCYISVDPSGQCAMVANYSSGSVAAFPIGGDGQLGPASYVDQHEGSSINPNRQQGPHAHAIIVDPSHQFALCTDLGMDLLFIYRLNAAAGELTPNEPIGAPLPAGAGPRHLVFHPTKSLLYVINELGSSVTTMAWDGEAGTAEALQTISTLPAGYNEETTCADIHLDAAGRFLYGSNRGHDSIAVFAINEDDGLLTTIEQTSTEGRTPRNFALSPDGKLLFAANQNTDTIVTFRRDEATGRLTPTGQVTAVPSPVCLTFAPVAE